MPFCTRCCREGAEVRVAAIGLLSAVLASAAAGGATARPAARRATLMPIAGEPFKVRGSGFHARERVRLVVRVSTGRGGARRVRASSRGTFVVAFRGVEACRGVSGVATGSRGSRASFRFSSLRC